MEIVERLEFAQAALRQFEQKNEKLLKEHDSLKKQVELADGQLRDWCKVNKCDAQGGGKRYQFQMPYRSWFDYDALKTVLPKKLHALLNQITHTEVDKKECEKLIKEGIFPKEIALAVEHGGAYREEAMTPRVITAQAQEYANGAT